MKIDISKATLAQLRAFATDSLGLEVQPDAKRAAVLALVQSAWDKPEITVEGPEAPEQSLQGEAPKPATSAQRGPPKGKVRVRIEIQEEAGGADDVPLRVNGRAFLVPRGKEVDIPERYFHALNNAVKHIYDPLPDGKGFSSVPRAVPAYPFSRVA